MRIDRVKLIAEMARQDLTVKALAEKSGVCRMTVTGIRSGKSCAEASGKAIAHALGVPVESIIEEVAK